MPTGNRVLGAITRMSDLPRVFSASMFERATRECRISPTIATESCSKLPLCRRMVSMSSMPWVGWAWRPSPPLMIARFGHTCSAMKCAAPESACLTTKMSAAMASRLRRVSNRVSPLLVELVDTLRVITSADRRWAASSKVVRVRVEFSKNTLHTVLPRSSGTFFTARAPTSRNESAVSRISVSSSRGRPSRDRKWRSWPWSFSCSGRLAAMVVIWRVSVGKRLEFEGQRRGAGQFYPLIRRQRQGRADYIRAHRQLAGIQVKQADQGYAGRAAVIEQLIERGADGAPAHQHVVDEHQVLAFDFERQFGGLHLRVQTVLGEVVTVEGHIENTQCVVAAQGFQQRLSNPDAASANADKARFADLPLIQVAGQGCGHLR